jgi:hypothetical protein
LRFIRPYLCRQLKRQNILTFSLFSFLYQCQGAGRAYPDTLAAPVTAVTVIEPGGIVYSDGVLGADFPAFSAQGAFGFTANDLCRFFPRRNYKQKIDDVFQHYLTSL